jgi:hypothetical protein
MKLARRCAWHDAGNGAWLTWLDALRALLRRPVTDTICADCEARLEASGDV